LKAQAFYDLFDAVWALDIDPTAKFVALRLARHWPHIFPGLQSLAKWTGYDERTVRRALRRLQDDGVITVTQRAGSSSVYAFVGVSIPALGKHPPLVASGPDSAPPPPDSAPPHPGLSAPRGGGVAPPEDPSLNDPMERTKEGESARELLPHEKAELRKALEPPTGARPVGLYQFREGWKPPVRLRQLGLRELGLTDAEMVDRLKHCRLKLYERPFPSEEAQFERELRWLAEDKKTKAFREQRKANPHGLDEHPGARRRPGDTPPAPVFGRRGTG
jgi:hypothetical protein